MCGGDFLLRRETIPFDRFGKILRDDVALLVENSEIELRLWFALFRRRMIPLHRFGIILRDALAGFLNTPRLTCAAESPCSAASRNHFAAWPYSCGTPMPAW